VGLCALLPAAAGAAPCERTLWGCPASDKPAEAAKDIHSKYDQLCARGRRALRLGPTATRELSESLTELSDATQLLPGQAEAWALLGAVLLELGRFEEAEPALRRADAAAEDGPVRSEGLAILDPQLDVLVGTGLTFLQALQGDVRGALERSRRLLGRRGQSHRALWRTADLLMALGNLEEATTLYERACTLPRSSATTALELARACHGLLVALDRGERSRSRVILRRATILDADHRVLEMADYFPSCDREYYRALVLGPGCTRRAAFQAYLACAQKQPAIPGSYLRRAEQHLQAEHDQSCVSDL
jgi:tetratricopeptide (TPR) repeat protein